MPKNSEKEKRIQQYVNSIQGLFKQKTETEEPKKQQPTPEDRKPKRPSS